MSAQGNTQAKPTYQLRIRAKAGDEDELGHVSNIAYVRFIQEVAEAHSQAVGLAMDSYLERGAIFVVRKHEVEYLRQAFAGDDLLLHTHVESFRGAQSERHTRISREADGTLLTRAVTTWAFINLKTGRPTRIPKDVQLAFYGDLPVESGHSS